MCNMLHELDEVSDKICFTYQKNWETEKNQLDELSKIIQDLHKDLFLRKHHNDELLDLGGKYV